MTSAPIPPFDTPTVVTEPESPADKQIARVEPRNFAALAVYQIVLRIAWIFKTESVIMPAFLDAVSGAGWVRGFLPVLNRFGQSVPPLILAERLKHVPRKTRPLMATTLLMAIPFLALSAILFYTPQLRQSWLVGLFLLLYALFFAATGLNQLSFAALQGKLIRAHHRGRLMGVSVMGGALTSITAAWILLPRWLALPNGGFRYIFLFTGFGFAVTSLVCLAIREPADHDTGHRRLASNHFRDAWTVFRQDRVFRRLAVVAMLFTTAQLLFPHYQALGRERLGTLAGALMIWVVAQNIGAGLFSLGSGLIADRLGNRLAIRLLIFASVLPPLWAVLLATDAVSHPGRYYWMTFLFIGTVPVTFRVLTNYTLEICEPARHPRYVSTLKFCMAIPFLFSPLVGLLVDLVGFQTVFLFITGLIVGSGLLTFRLSEPRHANQARPSGPDSLR